MDPRKALLGSASGAILKASDAHNQLSGSSKRPQEAKMVAKRRSDTRRLRIFEWALWRKANKYIFSGLVVIVVGIIVIIFGLLLNMVNYYPLVVGLGAIVVLVGIIRVLIGLIRPANPEDLSAVVEAKDPQQELHERIFD
jgi:hypothetical protein